MASKQTLITASTLYDLVQCPHRVSNDIFGNPADRDPISPFVQLLWDRGSAFEKETIGNLEIPVLDLSAFPSEDKERLTREAIARGEPLIYGGRIQAGDLLGVPDLLRHENGGYVAGDIKSGSAEEGGEDDKKPKVHYAVQLALYTDILEQLHCSAAKRGFIWDIHGEEVIYDFRALYGVRSPRTLWQDYEEALAEARGILQKSGMTLPAYSSGTCKNCHWYSMCLVQLGKSDDLTLIPELGRSKRDAMTQEITTISSLAEINPAAFISGKKTHFAGIGPDTLHKFHNRARLLKTPDAKPYLKHALQLPISNRELFFDIETDPMRDICYLHGFVERRDGNNETETFVYFFAEKPTPEAEELAFAESWRHLQESRPAVIYYYSKYERTIYRKLQAKYPGVCTPEEVEAMFDPALSVDLYYDVVLKATEWPTRDFSIKTLATHLGFTWRDTHPSGAASIEWFHRFVETGDASIRERILQYNEDDCRATRVLLDGIRSLKLL